MLNIDFKFPLSYPTGHSPRKLNMRGYDNGFAPDLTIEDALVYLESELKDLKASDVCFFSNYKNVGNPRLREVLDKDSGCMVTFMISGQEYQIVCDRWSLLAHNIYALHLLLHHARSFQKWGVGNVSDALMAYRHGAAKRTIPDAAHFEQGSISDWMELLGLGPSATLEDANATYRSRAKEAATDEGMLLKLNKAIESARRALS